MMGSTRQKSQYANGFIHTCDTSKTFNYSLQKLLHCHQNSTEEDFFDELENMQIVESVKFVNLATNAIIEINGSRVNEYLTKSYHKKKWTM